MRSTTRAPARGGVGVQLYIACLALCTLVLPAAWAQEEKPVQDLMISTHERLQFEREVNRVAVANPEIVELELLDKREALVLGKALGRTTVIVWFEDGSSDTYLFHVKRDLSILEEALRELHTSITVSSAPDRDAVVLRGVVPDVSYANAAEEMAQRYLDARRGGRRASRPSIRSAAGEDPDASPPAGAPPAQPVVEPFEEARASAAVINLIRVETLPGTLEERMGTALRSAGMAEVTVRRLVRGRLPNDEQDVFVLHGSVQDQTELVRTLSLAQSMLGARRSGRIRVLADESGALSQAFGGGSAGGGDAAPSSSALSELFGSTSSTATLDNLIEANLGRAKVIEAADGRLLSFIEVTDLPQVRVDIRLYEVNCTRLRAHNSDFGIIASNFNQGSLNPARAALGLQGPGASRVGSSGSDDVQNVLSFLSGTLSNQFQLSTDHFALDSLLSLLESKGFARSLSKPSLTVLSGERAFFQVGGEVPIPQALATNVTTDGVLNSVVFRPFGVQLSVRPLVGARGDVTLDLAPQVSLPDPQLTAGIRESTGTEQTTTSFRTRSLQTTAKLGDGKALLIGGLITRNLTSSDTGTPGLSDKPVVGGLFSGYERQGDEFQLVVFVHPVVLREPTNKARMWAFPDLHEVMRGAMGR